MKRSILALCLAAISMCATAQTHPKVYCGNEIMPQLLEQRMPGYNNAVKASFDRAKNHSNLRSGADTAIYNIKVIFHIVWNDPTENLDDSVILSEMKVINEDYRRHNADTVNTIPYFNGVGGDARIHFEVHDIRHVQTGSTFDILGGLPDSLIKQTDNGGDDAIDPAHFLNIWIVNIQSSFFGQLLGYSYPPDSLTNWPSGSIAGENGWDGVVIDYRCVGRNNPNPLVFSGQTLAITGRTATHEIGHYLGLRHIWGDGTSFFGTNDCQQSDGIDDTPFANTESSFDCDSTRNTCPQTETYYSDDAPDMVQNFMDYSSEMCENIFTKQQVALMRGVLSDQRRELVASNTTAIAAVKNAAAVTAFPNPTKGLVYLSFAGKNPYSNVAVYNMLGENTGISTTETPTTMKLDLSNLANGVYTIDMLQQGQHETRKIVLSK